MPSLLPREITRTTSVVSARVRRPSPSDHRLGFSSSFTRLLMGSLALRPALLLCGNSRPRVSATPLPHATGAHGQLPGRDFNPLDLMLLLRTDRPRFPPILFSVLLGLGCLLARPTCFPWNYPAAKHCGYFFCESWIAKGKIPIGGPANLVNETGFQLMTEQFSVGGLPLFTGPARTQIDRMVAQ